MSCDTCCNAVGKAVKRRSEVDRRLEQLVAKQSWKLVEPGQQSVIKVCVTGLMGVGEGKANVKAAVRPQSVLGHMFALHAVTLYQAATAAIGACTATRQVD